MHAIKLPLAPGQQITYPVPGTSATVTVHRTDNGRTEPVYLVFIAQGAHRPDGWTHTYPDETTARFEATRAAKLLHRYGNADRIEARRSQLTATVRDQERRQTRAMHHPSTLSAARSELDTLLTFADMAALIRLRADLSLPAA